MPNSPLPLPLVAFEEYMLRDDRPKFPMTIILRLRFTGRMDRQAGSAALKQVVARHPLLRAKVETTARGRLTWVPVEDNFPSIRWLEAPQPDRLPLMRPIDLFSESGLRAWATAGAQQSSLTLQVHHAVCDGKALLQVADDFLRSYAKQMGHQASAIELRPCAAETLRGRAKFGLTVLKTLRMLPAQLSGLWGVWKFLMRRPVSLLDATEASSGDLPLSFPDVKVGRLDANDVRRLSVAASESKVTVNDWLLRDFFTAVDDFRRRQKATTANQWIRFSVPMSLRHLADRRLPAANVVSMVFLERKRKQIADSAGLLRNIHAEMDLLLRRDLGLTFIFSLLVLRWLPGGMAKRVNNGCCDATCVLSNLGRVMADSPLPRSDGKIVAGNLVLEDIDFFAPFRDGTTVTLGLVFYAGRLQFCMQYDSRSISESQADDLMATYLSKIRSSLDLACRSIQGNAG